MKSININSNINLYYIPMTKLKTTTIDVYIHRDLNEEESSLNALLPYVLKRGCRLCSDSEAISKYLENYIYDVIFRAVNGLRHSFLYSLMSYLGAVQD